MTILAKKMVVLNLTAPCTTGVANTTMHDGLGVAHRTDLAFVSRKVLVMMLLQPVFDHQVPNARLSFVKFCIFCSMS